MRRIGLVHDFVVFAPDVPTESSYTEALVENSDGTVVVWNASKTPYLPTSERPAAERFRKLFDERVANIGYRAIWPDVIDYIGRSCTTQSSAPKRVSIVRVRRTIALSSSEQRSGKVETICTYDLTGGDHK